MTDMAPVDPWERETDQDFRERLLQVVPEEGRYFVMTAITDSLDAVGRHHGLVRKGRTEAGIADPVTFGMRQVERDSARAGAIEWNDPVVILPPRGPRVLIVAYVENGHRLVSAALFFGGAFRSPDDGFTFPNVRRWAMMPEFPDEAEAFDEPMG